MIQLKNVAKKYGNFLAVKDIDFEIKKGEIVGLLGPNGAGKSTIMNMITGFIEPTEGQVIINGFDIEKKPKKAKMNIGYMPEGVPLYADLTVKEFIRYMAELKLITKKTRKDAIDKILKDTGIDDVKNQLIKSLSRGYKQRVSLAGALVGEPQILVLDEPTVGLDPKQITEIRQLIKDLRQTHTVILSSHILSEVSQICERVIIINNGKIIAIDTPQNLENRVNAENTLLVEIEDAENKMAIIKDCLPNIKEIKLLSTSETGAKQYSITSNNDSDFRKTIFEAFTKEGITILEMKKTETTLEDAFMKLITEDKAEVKQNAEESKEGGKE